MVTIIAGSNKHFRFSYRPFKKKFLTCSVNQACTVSINSCCEGKMLLETAVNEYFGSKSENYAF